MTRSRKPTALLSSLVLAAVVLAGCLPSPTTSAAKTTKPKTVTTTTAKPPATTTTTAKPAPTTTTVPATTTTVAPAPPPSPAGFVHPGVLVSKAEIDLVRTRVATGQEPWASALGRLTTAGGSTKTAARPTSYRYGSLSYVPAPVSVIRAPSSSDKSWLAAHPEYPHKAAGDLEHLDDARAAYTQALLWSYTGNQAHADKAKQIMDAWSANLKKIEFDVLTPDGTQRLWDNGKLQAGWGASLFARAAEIIRYTGAGWSNTRAAAFGTMLRNVYQPLVITSWSNGANWLMTLAEATIAIGVYNDDRSVFDAGVAMWRQKAPTTIYLSTDGARPVPPTPHYDTDDRMRKLWHNPSSYVNGLQGETLRDLSHMTMGLGAMANAAQTAKLQGVDLFGAERTRIVAGFERSAGYVNAYLDKVASLGGAQPPADWRPSGWVGPSFSTGGDAYKSGWEVAYSHYAVAGGIPMPNTKRVVERTRPTGSALHMSWETLTHAR